jgi:hypothetical protein
MTIRCCASVHHLDVALFPLPPEDAAGRGTAGTGEWVLEGMNACPLAYRAVPVENQFARYAQQLPNIYNWLARFRGNYTLSRFLITAYV